MCPANLLSIGCDQASRTSSSLPSGSVQSRHVASSADRRSHSVADRRRISVDKAASAVQNVAAALFSFLFVAIKKKKNED